MFKPANSHLLLLDQKCAKCLLETYVKRSLSLNEGSRKHQLKQLKRVKQGSQARRASSDPSTHCLSADRLLSISKCPECATPPSGLRCRGQKPAIKAKRRSPFRGFLNLFSKKKVNREGASETDCGQSTERRVDTSSESSPGLSETLRKKLSLKKILLRDQHVEQRESLQTDSTPVPGGLEGLSDVSVDSSITYFERVSEELEWIVKEIQFSPKDDLPRSRSRSACVVEDCSSSGDDNTERIISLLKQHGDIIDQKISKNKSVQDFLQKLTYSSFQQLADRYIAQIPSPLPQTTDASPELVKLAFTLDFTAKVAGLCSQTVGRIMGFGCQYLQDSFTQMCAAHRQVPEDLEGQNTCDPD
ncbi:apoptosis facilitator Bcl-2-like protein [Pimephales promelas]|nr:apoptosis facilitator Bcl-2-like protein [Pimephales promelas]